MKAISVAEVINAAEFDPKPPGFWAAFTWFAPAVAMLLSLTRYADALAKS